MVIEAKGMHYRVLNENIRALAGSGEKEFILNGINGQRYIADAIDKKVRIEINGTPGNDLGAFMDGPEITVRGNAQDGTGNTMSGGSIVIHGDAGDILGHSMRGGSIYVKGDSGYRTGIHMKSYLDLSPVIVIGSSVRDFAGEYMAGGIMVILNNNGGNPAGNYLGTGMHGGIILVRGNIADFQLGKEVKRIDMGREYWDLALPHIKKYCASFSFEASKYKMEDFALLVPFSHRPYGRMYAY